MDTQADISLIKIFCLNSEMIFNSNNIINITGVTYETVSTLGTICTNLIISNFMIPIVLRDFNIPSDGILGKDFLRGNKRRIDYENMDITIFVREARLQIPILQSPKALLA